MQMPNTLAPMPTAQATTSSASYYAAQPAPAAASTSTACATGQASIQSSVMLSPPSGDSSSSPPDMWPTFRGVRKRSPIKPMLISHLLVRSSSILRGLLDAERLRQPSGGVRFRTLRRVHAVPAEQRIPWTELRRVPRWIVGGSRESLGVDGYTASYCSVVRHTSYLAHVSNQF